MEGQHHEGVAFDGGQWPDAQAQGTTFVDCELTSCVLDSSSMRGARVLETALTRTSVVAADLSRSTWRDVELTGCRLSASELLGAQLTRVRFASCRMDGVNFAGAQLTDVVFDDCPMTEADFAGAHLTRVSFSGCDLDRAQFSQAVLAAADLRRARLGVPRGLTGLAGAVITPLQLIDLAPAMAAHLGVVVSP